VRLRECDSSPNQVQQSGPEPLGRRRDKEAAGQMRGREVHGVVGTIPRPIRIHILFLLCTPFTSDMACYSVRLDINTRVTSSE